MRLKSLQNAEAWAPLRPGGNGIIRCAHPSENSVQPLEGTVQVDLNPAWGARHILAMVFNSPALYKTHTNRAHLGKLIRRFEAMVN